ncbi:breast cancer type 2 susceptibility protein [Embiotoca jacksoni]|uniref:breast cancer type 2 susceptibility protein n=1 Tax=Embiotoca jacksoni TaxID=100190 RepID=UPI0037037466
MDLPSTNMYDTFKDEIWKELGPLDPNWFELLTAQTSASEGSFSDQDDLCANQEGHFKAPLDKPAFDTQLFSTPKVFRRRQIVSPETEDEQSFTAEQDEGALRWTATQSPHLFQTSNQRVQGMKHGGIQPQTQDSFDLFHSPCKSPATYAKQISESLGAQINPDISWTSSLNTPPAVPSTLILSKSDESPCPVSVSADKKVVFVRELFPSLSNASTVGVPPPKTNDMPAGNQGTVSPEAESPNSPQASLIQSDGVWRQKLPDAIEDGEIRSTVASILDGAENVLSIFFANSSSALRKVKPRRIKRKHIVQTEERGCSSTNTSTTNNTVPSEEAAAGQEPVRFPSSPLVTTGDTANSQWSPLSLSQIPTFAVDDNISKEQLQSDSGCSPFVRPPMKITDSVINKKKRKFIYTVGTFKTQVQGKETQSQKVDSSPGIAYSGPEVGVKQLEKAPDDTDCSSNGKNAMEEQGNLAGENLPLPPSAQAKLQDLDMSQLCRDFAQDFSQIPDSVKLGKQAEGTERYFSPSACLSAMKQTKQKANPHRGLDAGSNRRCVSTTDQNYSINEGTVSDSGFQSAVADITRMTASSNVLPWSEKTGQSQHCSGFKTDFYRTFPSTNQGNRKVHLDVKAETELKERQTPDAGRKNELHIESMSTPLPSSTKETVTNINCTPINAQTHGSLPDKTEVSIPSVRVSGFRTASNKGVRISLANLERAKHLFEETEGGRSLSDQPTTWDRAMNGSSKSTASNSNQLPSLSERFGDNSYQLTDSQKADVTELCSLLEEADSQFEFTQFKTAKLNQKDDATSPQKADKELDPDYLTGIDFDDSFSSDTEKQQPDKMTSVSDDKINSGTSDARSKSTCMSLSSAPKKENSSAGDRASFSEHISKGDNCRMSTEPKYPHRAECTETTQLENRNPLMLGVAFKTAGGNVLRVSKKCLSQARALFADLGENLTGQKSPDEKRTENDAQTEQKCCMDSNAGTDDLKSTIKDNCDIEERIQESVCSDKKVSTIRDPDRTKCFENSKMDTTMCQSGFHMASGEGISISAKYMQQAGAFFKGCDEMDRNDGMSGLSIDPMAESVNGKKNLSEFKNPQRTKVNTSEEHVSGSAKFKNANGALVAHYTKGPHPEHMEKNSAGCNSTLALKDSAAFRGNLLTSKPFSSPLCTTSKVIDSSAIDKLSSGDGFSAASGKKVPVSAEAMKRAGCLLKEICILEDSKKQLNQKENAVRDGQFNAQIRDSPPKNDGFHTAGGKQISISSAALKKAKSLLSEADEDAYESGVNPSSTFKIPAHAPPPRNAGFLAASGKTVALSSEALQKAKALFSDTSLSTDIPAVSDARRSDKKQDSSENTEKIHCGFSTAGGQRVHVSQKTLLKAKHLLRECDDSASTEAMQEADAFIKDCDKDWNSGIALKHKSVAPVKGSGTEKRNLLNFKPDQRVSVNISEEPGNGKDTSTAVKQREDTLNGGFQTASGKRVAISSAALKKAKSLLSEGDEEEQQISVKPFSTFKIPAHAPPPRNAGFLSASGKTVAPSSEALQKAKALFSDISLSTDIPAVTETRNVSGSGSEKRNLSKFKPDQGVTVNVSEEPEKGSTEDTNKPVKQRDDTLPPQSGGFQTASGKQVAISSAALKKAKTLLSECEGVEDEIDVTPPPHSETPVPGPSFRNGGFLAASGKPVALSSEALRKAKALFSDISSSPDIPAGSNTSRSDKKHEGDAQNDAEKKHGGFRTAGGAKVHVSEKSLLKANKLFKELADGECHGSTSPHDTNKVDPSKVIDMKRTSDSNRTTTSDKNMSTKGSASLVVKYFPSLQETDRGKETIKSSGHGGCSFIKDEALTDAVKFQEDKSSPSGVGNQHDSCEQDASCASDYEMNQTGSSEGYKVQIPAESTGLNFQSVNLTGCTETQQQFLAQEALDCTKALLEDEGLAGQMTLENMALQDKPKSSNRSAEEEKRRGKRSVEAADITGQPPLKRRLLEDFDRVVDGPRCSTLHAVKSCPNGVMKDRSVFKYSVALHPNITRPHGSGKNYVETRFQKTTLKQPSTPSESRSTPSKTPAFVPPFIKNVKADTLKDNVRTTAAFVPPFKKQRTIIQETSSKPQEQEDKYLRLFVSNTYVPPTKNTPGATDVTAPVDTTSNNVLNNQSTLVVCGSGSSEASCADETSSRSQEYQTLGNTELARDVQDMRIRKKKRQTIRPLPGSLFLTRTCGVARIPLKVAVDGKPPARYTQKQLYGFGVHKHVSEITSETAESFCFNLLQFIKREALTEDGGIQLADGGWLIPRNDGTAGKEEFYRALCDTPGVDPKLISEAWVYNHFRWIVWKQSSMEKSFPETMGSLCLTPEQVLLQLKYRYDVEVDHSRRPALRKIMEKDDTAAKTLVLCVCEVVSGGHNDTRTPQGADAKPEARSAVVWLTDGWYAIKAQLDEPLTAMLHRGRLAVGGKLIVHGAQLVGPQEACAPLEAPESLMLKICANSSRPARWDVKLGFHKDPRPFLLPVSCLYCNGGPVGCVDIVILRSYPIQWMERKADGGAVFRSARAEEKEARRYNSHKEKAMEILFAKVQAEFEKEEKRNLKPQRRRQTFSHQVIASLQDGEELYEAVGDDPAYLEAHLSEGQLETLHTYRRSLMEKQHAELQDRYRRALEAEDNDQSCPKRDVAPVWRLGIADSLDQTGSVYRLNLWRPSSDLQSLLKEGCRYKAYNLTASDGKNRSSIQNVQLTGTKKTQFQELQASQEWLSARFKPRVSTNVVSLQNSEFQPLCGEVDLTGCLVSIIDGQGSSPAFYLADGKLNFVKVRCFSSLSQSGLEDVLKPGVLLAVSNLQLRGQSMYPTPVVYAGDLTVFSANPKEVHLQESLSQLKNLVQSQENFFLTAEEKLSLLVKSDGVSSICSPALQPQTPAPPTDRRQDSKTSVISQKPIRSLGSFTPVSRNPMAATSSTEKDPKSLKRRRAVDYLSRIPSPPPLFNLSSSASPCVNKTFNPPRRSGTSSTLKTVQTPAHKPVDSPREGEWVNDEELAMIDTQALCVGELL